MFDQPNTRREQNLTRDFGDPLWDSIQAEAHAEARREPLLRPLLEQTVLQQSSFDNGIAMLLSQRLSADVVDSVKFYEEVCNVISSESFIAESAKRDVTTIRAKDPTTTTLLHPFLNFKGFLADQGYRIAHLLWTRDRRALAYHIQSRVSEVLGVDIHPAANIGSGIFIDHGTGVVIGETAVVGDDVTI